MSTKQAKRRRAAGDGKAKPDPRSETTRSVPSWVLPVVVLLIAFGVIALALVAKQSRG